MFADVWADYEHKHIWAHYADVYRRGSRNLPFADWLYQAPKHDDDVLCSNPVTTSISSLESVVADEIRDPESPSSLCDLELLHDYYFSTNSDMAIQNPWCMFDRFYEPDLQNEWKFYNVEDKIIEGNNISCVFNELDGIEDQIVHESDDFFFLNGEPMNYYSSCFGLFETNDIIEGAI